MLQIKQTKRKNSKIMKKINLLLGAVAFIFILGSCSSSSDKKTEQTKDSAQCKEHKVYDKDHKCSKSHMITKEEINEAQKLWGNAIVEIGKAKTDGGDFEAVATKKIDELYGYEQGVVLFKPTKAAEKQFRLTKEGALSYFVGNNQNFPEDKGFALQPWTKVRFENSDMILNKYNALAMGNYFFTTLEGEEVKVEFSFGYFKDKEGTIRINLHHSSLPYHKK